MNKTVIHQPSNLWGNPSIGEGCIIAAFVEIGKDVVIGRNCKIQAHSYIPPGVTIGDNVFIGPHVCFTNDKYPKVGGWSNTRLMPTIVENDVSIGANATILCGVTLGQGCMIGMGTVVTKDIPPHTLVFNKKEMVISKKE